MPVYTHPILTHCRDEDVEMLSVFTMSGEKVEDLPGECTLEQLKSHLRALGQYGRFKVFGYSNEARLPGSVQVTVAEPRRSLESLAPVRGGFRRDRVGKGGDSESEAFGFVSSRVREVEEEKRRREEKLELERKRLEAEKQRIFADRESEVRRTTQAQIEAARQAAEAEKEAARREAENQKAIYADMTTAMASLFKGQADADKEFTKNQIQLQLSSFESQRAAMQAQIESLQKQLESAISSKDEIRKEHALRLESERERWETARQNMERDHTRAIERWEEKHERVVDKLEGRIHEIERRMRDAEADHRRETDDYRRQIADLQLEVTRAGYANALSGGPSERVRDLTALAEVAAKNKDLKLDFNKIVHREILGEDPEEKKQSMFDQIGEAIVPSLKAVLTGAPNVGMQKQTAPRQLPSGEDAQQTGNKSAGGMELKIL